MTAHALKSFVWLWMAALLSATMGMSVQQVYCYCEGKTTVSLFDLEDACLSADAKEVSLSYPIHIIGTGCCAQKVAATKHACCKAPQPQQRGCTKKTTQVFQLKTEFEVGSSDFKKLEPPQTWAIAPGYPVFFTGLTKVQSRVFQRFEQPPPALSGRMICVRYGVFRC